MTRARIDCSGLVHMSYRRLGRLVPRDAGQQEAAGEDGGTRPDLRPGDLVCYEGHSRSGWERGRDILHSTQREGVNGVVEEPEPAELRRRFNRYVRLLNRSFKTGV